MQATHTHTHTHTRHHLAAYLWAEVCYDPEPWQMVVVGTKPPITKAMSQIH